MNIILFGPPGVGKSTLIGYLKTHGVRAIDLEDIYPSKIRFQIPSMVDGVVLGGADLQPARKYHNTIKILLSMDQQKYDNRRAKRDAEHPGKASQNRHLISNWLKGVQYDYIIDASGDVASVGKQIAKLLRKEK